MVSKPTAVVLTLVLLPWAFLACSEKPGSLFLKTFGFEVPIGAHVINEHRIIKADSLYCHYYGKLKIDNETAFQELCADLE